MSKDIRFNVVGHSMSGSFSYKLYVDGKQWAEIRNSGRNGFSIMDLENYSHGSARTKDEAIIQAKQLIQAGMFPSPEQAWKMSIQRAISLAYSHHVAQGSMELYEMLLSFISAVKDNPEVANMPVFKEMTAKVVEIVDNAAKMVTAQYEKARDTALNAHEVSAAQFGYSTPDENARARENFISQERLRLEDAERRLAFAAEVIREVKANLGVQP